MTRVLALLTLLLVGSVAWAAEHDVSGKVKSFNATSDTLTLANGTQITITDDTKVQRTELAPGADVRVSYEDQDGKNIARSIEVSPLGIHK